MRLPVHSRSGNIVFAVLGSVYAVSALSILIWFVVEVWGAARLSDRAVQFALAAAVVCGIWIAFHALANLSLRHPHRPWQVHKANP